MTLPIPGTSPSAVREAQLLLVTSGGHAPSLEAAFTTARRFRAPAETSGAEILASAVAPSELQAREEPRLEGVISRLERRRAEVVAALASKGPSDQ